MDASELPNLVTFLGNHQQHTERFDSDRLREDNEAAAVQLSAVWVRRQDPQWSNATSRPRNVGMAESGFHRGRFCAHHRRMVLLFRCVCAHNLEIGSQPDGRQNNFDRTTFFSIGFAASAPRWVTPKAGHGMLTWLKCGFERRSFAFAIARWFNDLVYTCT